MGNFANVLNDYSFWIMSDWSNSQQYSKLYRDGVGNQITEINPPMWINLGIREDRNHTGVDGY
jgi:hypothetical protein